MDKQSTQNFIAQRVAQEFSDGDVVNLGIGLPTLVANHLPDGVHLILQSENGFIDLGPAPEAEAVNPAVVNAGGQYASILPGGACFDSATSFAIIRGGHVDATVLGSLQVDQEGNLANWIIPGKLVPGMGGAMDLVVGSRRVIIAMEHTVKGRPKILKSCTLPLTAKGQVDLVITELCVLERVPEGLLLKELREDISIEALRACTEATLFLPERIGVYGKEASGS